jgi:hypothetical protein
MKQTIQYENLDSPETKAKAIADCEFYLGYSWEKVTGALKEVTDPDQFGFWCSMVGIQGFPVVALYEHLTGQNYWEQKRNKLDPE